MLKEKLEQRYQESGNTGFSPEGRLYQLVNSSSCSKLSPGSLFLKLNDSKWVLISDKEDLSYSSTNFTEKAVQKEGSFLADSSLNYNTQLKDSILFFYGYRINSAPLVKYLLSAHLERFFFYNANLLRTPKLNRPCVYYGSKLIGYGTRNSSYVSSQGNHEYLSSKILEFHALQHHNHRYSGVDTVIFTAKNESDPARASKIRSYNKLEDCSKVFSMGSYTKERINEILHSLIKENVLLIQENSLSRLYDNGPRSSTTIKGQILDSLDYRFCLKNLLSKKESLEYNLRLIDLNSEDKLVLLNFFQTSLLEKRIEQITVRQRS